jgi:hypothetical protein
MSIPPQFFLIVTAMYSEYVLVLSLVSSCRLDMAFFLSLLYVGVGRLVVVALTVH